MSLIINSSSLLKNMIIQEGFDDNFSCILWSITYKMYVHVIIDGPAMHASEDLRKPYHRYRAQDLAGGITRCLFAA